MPNLKNIAIKNVKIGEEVKYKTGATEFIAIKTGEIENRILMTVTKTLRYDPYYFKGKELNFYDDDCFYEVYKPKEIETFTAKNNTIITSKIKKQ